MKNNTYTYYLAGAGCRLAAGREWAMMGASFAGIAAVCAMSDPQHLEGNSYSIPVRSKRQAMDWSLVLASQGIAATINRADTGWELSIDKTEAARARASLIQYQKENRGWHWRQDWPAVGLTFHWGALLWVLAIAVFYNVSMVQFPWLKSDGMVDSQAVLRGQWWRLFTAVTLHEDMGHLAANAGIRCLLLGLAMARYGGGIGLLAAYLAGVAGNIAGVLVNREAYYSLGASGMVTGALGLISVQTFAPWRSDKMSVPLLPRAVAAGVLLLVLIGFGPGSDWLAHVGGFVAGVALGLALAWVRPPKLREPAANVVAGLATFGLAAVAWLLATRH